MRKQLLQSALAKTRETPPLPFQTTFISPDSWPFSTDGSGSTGSIAATKSPIRIAVLDSSFNPPTRAHYQLLKAAANVGCDAVLLLLATNNADKGQMGAGAVERLEMMEAMAEHSIKNENHHPALRQMAIGLTARHLLAIC
ncbi:hypothetical protein BGW38_005183 [Lunasporangiospora selenospora]|uniref:Cytidyltransferase-like domain-containing protein n=1 Tax=Lunasporangiospora selenospora TaxID=979761 RepID=A0A9P6KBI8_9FUNG|nr:hypothetical protein BGW38_005183 [Lunasporangiospora selenospora]